MLRRLVRPPILFVILTPLILFSPLLFTGKAMFWGTPATQFVPWWSYAADVLRSGHLPLWNPYLGMGAPLIANYQSGIFYPPNWIYFVLEWLGGTPLMAWGLALIAAAHLAWAGTGMVLLAKRLGIGELGQTIAGISYGLSGYLVSRSGFLSINSASAWLPWVILGVTALIDGVKSDSESQSAEESSLTKRIPVLRSKTLKPFLWLSVILGLLLLAGHAQIAWYTIILAFAWALLITFKRLNRNSIWKALVILIIAVIFSVSIAAVQLLPTVEYLFESQRSSSVDYESAMSYSLWPWQFTTLIAPDLFGSPVDGDYWGYANYWEEAIYIGLAPLLLVIIAISTWLRKSKTVLDSWGSLIPALLVIILLSFTLALGWYTPIFPWLYRHIPTFDMFQGPARISLLAVFSLSILAGIGAELWRRPSGKALYWSRLGVMAAVAVAASALAAGLLTRLAELNFEQSFVRSLPMAGVWGAGFGILTLTAPGTHGMGQPANYRRRWYWAACSLIAADLVFASWGIIPGIDREFYAGSASSLSDVRSMIGDGRLYLPLQAERELKFERFFRFDTFDPPQGELGWDGLRDSLLPNLTLLDKIPTANNFDPLLPGRYAKWISSLSDLSGATREELISLMGVSLVEILNEKGKGEVGFIPHKNIPRVTWVPCAISASSGDAAINLVLGGEVNFEEEAVIEGSKILDEDCGKVAQPELHTRIDEPHRLVVEINAGDPGYLVISDVWYPGWRAYVDGQRVGIKRANYLFRGLSIPAGEHVIEMRYQPISFLVGGLVSAAAWLAWIFLSVTQLRRSTR